MALMAAGFAFGQATPTHPLDIDGLNFPDATFNEWFPAWTVGQPPMQISKLDDEFYISRTRPLQRISKEDDTYDANPDAPYDRKFCGFYGATDPTDTWKTLPRYCFEGDNYSMWAYTDMFSNWTSPFFRCTAGLSDVAAKNGATVGCCWTIGYGDNVYFNGMGYNDNSKKGSTLCEKNADGTFKYAEKLVRLLKYYGINAVGFNSEFYSSTAAITQLSDFFAECHKIADELGWKFEVHWYAGTNDGGSIRFDVGLTGSTKVFGTADHKMSDMFFLNYNWSESHFNSIETTAADLNRSSYDVFAGFDIQGRGVRRNEGATHGWDWIKSHKVSIGFWGAHQQNLIHQSSSDYGTTDISMQRAYAKKQELIANGGYNNPAVRPAINENVNGLGLPALESFHGLAEMMTAKSTIQQLPFVTRFNMGNGQKFYNRGNVTFDSKWYNLGTQDFLPTWHWWITDNKDQATKDNIKGFVKADMTWDDAWFGGSCLSLSGATTYSRVKLFKTLLDAKSGEELSIVYKPIGSADSHLKLFVSLKGAITDYKEIAVPAGNPDEWNTFKTTLGDLGVTGGKVALIGLVVENTPADYQTLVGELALRDPSKTFAPVKPQVKELEVLRGRFNAVDFKMRYAAKEETGEMKTYNDEVDTWYYEIFIQQEGEQPVLLTATPSWAAYVVGAPLRSGLEGRNARFGVRAVSPNGNMYDNNASEIAWTEYQAIPYDQPLTDVTVDKAVIKPDETFTLKYVDDMADPAKWEIIRANTGDVIATADNSTSLTTKLPFVGVYDLRITGSDGKVTMLRSQVQITPETTGAVPEVTDITAENTSVVFDDELQMQYVGREGEGKVSRAVKIADPELLQIDGNVQVGKVYSYALWFKADRFDHLSNGTTLIHKGEIKDEWPHNNWGDLWVLVRPEGQNMVDLNRNVVTRKSGLNEVSFNTLGWHDRQEAWEDMISKDHSVQPGAWTHIVVTHEANNLQKIYFNGKLVAQGTPYDSQRRETMAASDARIKKNFVAPINIGGSGSYRAAFNGAVDEVQIWNKALDSDEVERCMQGYAPDEVPDALQGYYTFETRNADGSFPNLGKGNAAYTAKIVALEGAGGETTNEAAYVQHEADNSLLGNPGIEGSIDVKAEATWKIQGGKVVSATGKTATVTYYTLGKNDVSVTLTNNWGSNTLTKPEFIEVKGKDGAVDNVAADELEVSTYNGAVSLRFAEAGTYTINIIALNGTTVQSEVVEGEAGGIVTVELNAQSGAYLVQVLLDNHPVKVVKIVK